MLNFLITVVVSTYRQYMVSLELQGAEGSLLITDLQRKYIQYLKDVIYSRRRKTFTHPQNLVSVRIRRWLKVNNIAFETAMSSIVVLNLIILSVQHYRQSSAYDQLQRITNFIFTSLYSAEVVLKLLAFSYQYFRSPWNVFDFTAVTVAWLDIILSELGESFGFLAVYARSLKLFRAVRVIRLGRVTAGIRRLFVTFLLALPSLLNIGVVLFFLMFVFAAIGLHLFSDVIHNGVINEVVNFETFVNAYFVMLRLSTQISWDNVLNGLSVQPPFCDPHFNGRPNGNCGSPTSANIFLFLYVLIVSFVVVALYVAAVIEAFSNAKARDYFGYREGMVRRFFEHWSRFQTAG
jgi:hypothetical protein